MKIPQDYIIKWCHQLELYCPGMTPDLLLLMLSNRHKIAQLLAQSEVEPVAPKFDEWLTTDECAVKLKCSRQTVYNMLKDGRLTYRKLGTGSKAKIRILQSDVNAPEPKKRKKRAVKST